MKLHSLRITGGTLLPAERVEVAWVIVEVVSLDTDQLAEFGFSLLDKMLQVVTQKFTHIVTGLQGFCGRYVVV